MILNRFFGHDIDYSKAVTLFSIHHLIYVLSGITTVFLILKYAKKIKEMNIEPYLKKGVAIFLILLEIMYHIHNWTYPRLSIPLHICSFATFMAIYLLLTDNERTFKYLFFFGTLGGAMALLIPLSLGYTYYNFRYYHFIFLHCTIIAVPLYYYKAYDFRVTYRNVWGVYKAILLLAILIHLINLTFIHFGIESNYWYITTIPANVEKFFSAWAIYIVTFMTAVFTTMNLLYFVTRDEYTLLLEEKDALKGH
jgi:hypothetical integral membrane protein (TIGR02206 family)